MPLPSLCSLADVKAWLNLQNNAGDALLTTLIGGVSADFLREIDRQDFTPAATYTDVITLQSHNLTAVLPVNIPWYWKGVGEFRIGLNHWPVNSILSVTLDGSAVPLSPDGIQDGYYFNFNAEPEFRDTLLLIGQYVHLRQSKLTVVYSAGYGFPALAAPAAPVLSAVAGGTLAGATYYGKLTLSTTAGESIPGAEANLVVGANNLPSIASPQAAVNSIGYNVYLATATGVETKQNATPIPFGTAWTLPTTGLISGAALPTVDASAGSVPADVAQAVIEWCAFRYRSRESIGKASIHMQQGESVTFDRSAKPSGVQECIDFYSRSAALDF